MGCVLFAKRCEVLEAAKHPADDQHHQVESGLVVGGPQALVTSAAAKARGVECVSSGGLKWTTDDGRGRWQVEAWRHVHRRLGDEAREGDKAIAHSLSALIPVGPPLLHSGGALSAVLQERNAIPQKDAPAEPT